MTKKVEMDQYDETSLGDPMPEDRIDEYAPKIGALILYFSELEHTLNRELVQRISDRADTEGYTIIGTMSYRQKVELFQNLFGPFVACVANNEETKRFENICCHRGQTLQKIYFCVVIIT